MVRSICSVVGVRPAELAYRQPVDVPFVAFGGFVGKELFDLLNRWRQPR